MNQQVIALVIVAVAAGWLALRWWRALRNRKKSCGCEQCPRSKPPL